LFLPPPKVGSAVLASSSMASHSSWQVSDSSGVGNVSRKRRGFDDISFSDPRAIAVEIVSAELAQDGGPAPDVRCTIAQRSTGAASPRVVGTSICRLSWAPVWKETLRLELEQGTKSTRFFDLVLWDEGSTAEGGESSCLGELVSFF